MYFRKWAKNQQHRDQLSFTVTIYVYRILRRNRNSFLVWFIARLRIYFVMYIFGICIRKGVVILYTSTVHYMFKSSEVLLSDGQACFFLFYVLRPIWELFSHVETSLDTSCRWSATHSDLCLALTVIVSEVLYGTTCTVTRDLRF